MKSSINVLRQPSGRSVDPRQNAGPNELRNRHLIVDHRALPIKVSGKYLVAAADDIACAQMKVADAVANIDLSKPLIGEPAEDAVLVAKSFKSAAGVMQDPAIGYDSFKLLERCSRCTLSGTQQTFRMKAMHAIGDESRAQAGG